MRLCSVPGCPELYPTTHGTRCPQHRRQADRARGNRGYASKGHRTFRTAVIRKHPICVICNLKPSTIADHHPHSRKHLIQLGLNPNNPDHGRGLCKQCHDSETARNQPGGWNHR